MNSCKKKLITLFSCLFSLIYLYCARFGIFAPEINRGIYVGFTYILVLLIYPAGKKNNVKKLIGLDMILIFLTILCIGYFILEYPDMAYRAGFVTKTDMVMGIFMIIISLEISRRVSGPILPGIAVFFLIYAYFGNFFMGMLAHKSFSIARIIGFMYTSLDGIFGQVVAIFSTYIFPFILFGTFLEKSGAATFFIDFPNALTGKRIGGPAKVSVLSSGLMGSISGSGVANVVTTGTFTIPLMKKIGYRPHVAAAIETAASAGGQVMPPIMGAGVFLMTEFVGVPYWDIVKVSFFPAFLYFLSVYIMVDLEARKTNIKPVPDEELPVLVHVIRKGWMFVLPLIFVILLLIKGYSPTLSAFYGSVTTFLVSLIRKDTRMNVKDVVDTLAEAAKKSLIPGSTVGSIGMIIGIVYLTGLGLKLSDIILSISDGFLPLTIILVAVAAYILGMGLTVTSSYVVLAILAAPALTSSGLSPIAAHLIIFWVCQMANITPPVCLAAFAGAGIAGADPMRTGWNALKYGKALYIIPFLMAYTQILALGLTVYSFLIYAFFSAGMLFSCFTLQGFALKKCSWAERFLCLILAILFFYPSTMAKIIACIAASLFIAYQVHAHDGVRKTYIGR